MAEMIVAEYAGSINLADLDTGELKVVGFHGYKQRKTSKQWYCKCECVCGKTSTIAYTSLLSGSTKSCGCTKNSKISAAVGRHRKSGTRIHNIWRQMRKRCSERAKGKDREWYFARGIRVCERWQNSFEDFLEDMGEPPPRMSLDRKDNNGHYEPSNCHWATSKTQARNTRRNKRITLNGVTKILADWLEEFCLSGPTFRNRIRRGWTEQESLTGQRG